MTCARATCRQRWRPRLAGIHATISTKRCIAPQSLEALARQVLARVPRVICTCAGASHHAPEHRGYVEQASRMDRAWRVVLADAELFCVIADHSERSLLGWLLGRIQTTQPSPIERAIVAEAIRRLLGLEDDRQPGTMFEEPRVRPSSRSWCCAIELRDRDGQSAAVELFTEEIDESPPPRLYHPNLCDVPLQLRTTLPSLSCALTEIRTWHPGVILRFRRHENDLTVLLTAGGRRVASGQLGAIFGDRAVRLLEVFTSLQL